MVSKTFTIQNKYGIHARPARLIVETAVQFKSEIHLAKNNEEIDAKSIMGILMLEASKGSELLIKCDGEDEKEALQHMTEVFEKISELTEWEEV
ncbi:HPr family phosphocarrier protein [candidate division KSB1 bacterium]|nr:HPr family phosphocarrier protein [candidate division KSB1 bacterium]RQW06743.1 MAG: HPr family phosphocarrier protein [candidate division KSB1 bacterium]